MPHVALLGDSIFDNQSYVQPGEPDVIRQLRAHLLADWEATLLAVDGSVTADIRRQLAHLPTDATHLVISVGGNDALGHLDALTSPASSVAEAVARLAAIQDQFEPTYRSMLDGVLAYRLPTAVCTIYNGNFPDPAYQRLATFGVTSWDDTILRCAIERGLPVTELRLICTDAADYANPIEPSARGGNKIAAAIAALITSHDFTHAHTQVYTLPSTSM
ncbi:MAG TPA: GDSL-type esterase/lipase family protein [Ktedonobacterales bacterium]|nr:GDSL-type esterase/lipase family protein [Ktedonobacterales bacterium]